MTDTAGEGVSKSVRQGKELMIRSANIENFRCFKRVNLRNCSRVNIVVGENGSGKTALLEALFLARGPNPEPVLRLRRWRGFDGTFTGPPKIVEDAVWKDLFHNFDTTHPVQIDLNGTRGENRSLRITCGRSDLLAKVDPEFVESRANAVGQYIFEWRPEGRLPYTVIPEITEGKLVTGQTPVPPFETFFFAANHTYSSAETAMRYSELSKEFKESEVVALFKAQFPMVKSLSIEAHGGAPLVFATIEGASVKVPLNILSGGINKLAAILFAIPSQRDSLVIVDEIENGLHYKTLPNVWRSLRAFAAQYSTQIFASTHSGECLDAATEVAAEYPDDFSLIQATRDNGTYGLNQFGGARLVEIMNDRIEIR
jgi:ABC-type lipoprotein export system ATPase subunit